jgi:hypothetical protein
VTARVPLGDGASASPPSESCKGLGEVREHRAYPMLDKLSEVGQVLFRPTVCCGAESVASTTPGAGHRCSEENVQEDDVIEEGFDDEVEEDSARLDDERHDENGFRLVRASPGNASDLRAAPVVSALAREAKS